MTLKSDAKFEEKLTCCLENGVRNLANFHQSTRKCQNWNFNGILLSKVENVQRRYVSWQWRMIHKLNRNWLVVFKLTWGTSQILTWALKKICVLIGSLWPKYIMFELQKYREVIFHDTQELNKFWRKFVLWFEKWREIWQSFTRALVSAKIGTLMGSFCPK